MWHCAVRGVRTTSRTWGAWGSGRSRSRSKCGVSLTVSKTASKRCSEEKWRSERSEEVKWVLGVGIVGIILSPQVEEMQWRRNRFRCANCELRILSPRPRLASVLQVEEMQWRTKNLLQWRRKGLGDHKPNGFIDIWTHSCSYQKAIK